MWVRKGIYVPVGNREKKEGGGKCVRGGNSV